jgi:WD40 repeat protein
MVLLYFHQASRATSSALQQLPRSLFRAMVLDLVLQDTPQEAAALASAFSALFPEHTRELERLTQLPKSAPELKARLGEKLTLALPLAPWRAFLDFVADQQLRCVTSAVLNFVHIVPLTSDASLVPAPRPLPLTLSLPEDRLVALRAHAQTLKDALAAHAAAVDNHSMREQKTLRLKELDAKAAARQQEIQQAIAAGNPNPIQASTADPRQSQDYQRLYTEVQMLQQQHPAAFLSEEQIARTDMLAKNIDAHIEGTYGPAPASTTTAFPSTAAQNTKFTPLPPLTPATKRALCADAQFVAPIRPGALPSAIAFTLLNAGRNRPTAWAVSSHGEYVAVGFQDHSLRVWAIAHKQTSVRGYRAAAVTSVGLDAAAQPAYTTAGAVLSAPWPQTQTQQQQQQQQQQPQPASCACQGACQCSWRMHRLNLHASAATAIAFSPCGQYLLCSARDGTVTLVQLAYMQVLYRYNKAAAASGIGAAGIGSSGAGSHAGVTATVWAPRGHYFLTCGADGYARLWATDKPVLVRGYHCRGHTPTAAAFHPNGQYVFVAADTQVLMFEVLTAELVRVFTGHSARVRALQPSPSGHLLATVGADAAVCLWSVAQGALLWKTDGAVAFAAPAHATAGAGGAAGTDISAARDGGFSKAVSLADTDVDIGAAVSRAATVYPSLKQYLYEHSLPAKCHTQPLMIDGQLLVRPACAQGTAHSGVIVSCSWSSCSRYFVTGGLDGTVKLWSADVLPTASNYDTFGKQDLVPMIEHVKTLEQHLVQTLHTKYTHVYHTQFTPRNLVMVLGVFNNPSQSVQ